jgi:hypothetical protein
VRAAGFQLYFDTRCTRKATQQGMEESLAKNEFAILSNPAVNPARDIALA